MNSDFFIEDIVGGAELTTEALVEEYHNICSKFHSNNLTIDFLKKNQEKHFIVCNFSFVNNEVIKAFSELELSYSIVEYDFKFCRFRSPYRHLLETNEVCMCEKYDHGKNIEKFFLNSKNLFWMSEKQKEIYEFKFNSLKNKENSFVLSSVFDKNSLNLLKQLSNINEKNKKCALVKSNSWLKGFDNSKAWLEYQKIQYDILEEKNYKKFLRLLNEYDSLAFHPVEWDTCPRLVIEAKLLNLNLFLNNNVLHKDEFWFQQSKEEIFNYLNGRSTFFWNKLI
jgi:hypothetical protein